MVKAVGKNSLKNAHEVLFRYVEIDGCTRYYVIEYEVLDKVA